MLARVDQVNVFAQEYISYPNKFQLSTVLKLFSNKIKNEKSSSYYLSQSISYNTILKFVIGFWIKSKSSTPFYKIKTNKFIQNILNQKIVQVRDIILYITKTCWK